jgi:hypothetical protein
VTDVIVQQGDLQPERTKLYLDRDLVAVFWTVVLQQRQQWRSDGTRPQRIEAGLKATFKAAKGVPVRSVRLAHHILRQFVILDEHKSPICCERIICLRRLSAAEHFLKETRCLAVDALGKTPAFG